MRGLRPRARSSGPGRPGPASCLLSFTIRCFLQVLLPSTTGICADTWRQPTGRLAHDPTGTENVVEEAALGVLIRVSLISPAWNPTPAAAKAPTKGPKSTRPIRLSLFPQSPGRLPSWPHSSALPHLLSCSRPLHPAATWQNVEPLESMHILTPVHPLRKALLPSAFATWREF